MKFDANKKAISGNRTDADCGNFAFEGNNSIGGKFKINNTNNCLNIKDGLYTNPSEVNNVSCTDARQDTVTWKFVPSLANAFSNKFIRMERNDGVIPEKCLFYDTSRATNPAPTNNIVGSTDCTQTSKQRWHYIDNRLIPADDTSKCLKFGADNNAIIGNSTDADCARFQYDGTNFKSLDGTRCLNLHGRNYANGSVVNNFICSEAQPDTIKWKVNQTESSEKEYQKIWRDAGCTTPSNYTNWQRGQTRQGLITDSGLWATLNSKGHREGCYGTDKTTWPFTSPNDTATNNFFGNNTYQKGTTTFDNQFVAVKRFQNAPGGDRCLYYHAPNRVPLGSWECVESSTQKWKYDGEKLMPMDDPTKCLKYGAHNIATVGNVAIEGDCAKIFYDGVKMRDRNNNCLNLAGGVYTNGAVLDNHPCSTARQDTVNWFVRPNATG